MNVSPRAALKGKTPEQINVAYREVFNSPSGETVLADLMRKVRQSRIDADHPDGSACIYQAAQLALVQFITNKLEKEDDDRIIAGTGSSITAAARRTI